MTEPITHIIRVSNKEVWRIFYPVISRSRWTDEELKFEYQPKHVDGYAKYVGRARRIGGWWWHTTLEVWDIDDDLCPGNYVTLYRRDGSTISFKIEEPLKCK